jgi:threonine/homoserine/homoserine lactone efflux protein
MDQRDILDHQFVAAAYAVTWVIQLGYLAFLGIKWRREKSTAERHAERKSPQTR